MVPAMAAGSVPVDPAAGLAAHLRPRAARRAVVLGARARAAAAPALGAAPAQAELAALAGPGAQPPAPWRVAGLPQQTLPLTRFELVDLDGRRALRIASDGSYGNLVHPVRSGSVLAWQWRLDRPLAAADLRRQAGDDAALKVCALFDLPLAALPFWERQKMRLARSLSGEPLPAATLCYVWDPALPAGSVLPNAYTPRLRWMVLQGQGSALGQWQAERRDLRADVVRAFGDEARPLPPLLAIAVGADADNTGGQALGHVADLVLAP